MRYSRFIYKDREMYGVLDGGVYREVIGDIYGSFTLGEEAIPADGARLLVPCVPTKIVAVGKNYFDHVKEMGGEVPKTPILFIKPTSALLPEGGTIVRPSGERVDYEGELCFIVKKTAKKVRKDEASGYISGYACFNDVTARDVQSRDGQWTRAKGYDTFAAVGGIVSDEIDPDNVSIETRLNGKVVQSSSTSLFMHDIGALMEFITDCMTLLPGDIVTTGTPAGIGPMRGGDTVEVEIGGIGTLTNTVE